MHAMISSRVSNIFMLVGLTHTSFPHRAHTRILQPGIFEGPMLTSEHAKVGISSPIEVPFD
jgi:hypothetical protein